MALALLALANVKTDDSWQDLPELIDEHTLSTREIIDYLNVHYEETISSGSYDDIRRKDLRLSVAANIVINSMPNTAQNNPQRAYQLNPTFADILAHYGTSQWDTRLTDFLQQYQTLRDELSIERNLETYPVKIDSDTELQLSAGKHNQLQKAIIEEFLPRYGYHAEVLYLGDANNRMLHIRQEKLKQLKFFSLNDGSKLPDIIAYSNAKNWLYIIEAVHTSGAIDQLRLRTLKQLTSDCTADIVYVTAFLDVATFRKFAADIAWETEAWIAEQPDHLIHFDGGKFLGPY